MTLTAEPAPETVAHEVSDSEISDYEKERGKPMPSRNHGALELLLGSALLQKYRASYSVFTEVTLDTTPPLTPDIAVVQPKLNLDWAQDEIRLSAAPILVVEILSPTQSVNALVEKSLRYFEAGVKSYWLVMPTHKLIAVHTPDAEPVVFTHGSVNDPASEISVTIEEIFQ